MDRIQASTCRGALLATAVIVDVIVGAVVGMPAVAAPRTDLVLAIGGEPDQGYDPLLGWGRYGHPLFQSTLLVRDADLRTQPDLATEWTLSDDRLTWTLSLRDDVKFSDGSALTAEDVAFTFTRAAASGGAVDLTAMVSAVARDARTVIITLKEPRITFAENFYTLGIVPADGYGADYARHPIGSGPYRLVSWAEGEQLIVEANPYFHGSKQPFDRLVFLFTGEDTSYAAAMAGEVDMVSVPAVLADRAPHGMRSVVADTVDNRGIAFPMLPATARTTQDGASIGNAVTSDAAIRHAINLGIDRETLVDVALSGHGTPAYGPADGLPWSNPDAAAPDGDMAAAAHLLDEAGWTVGTDGVREKDGVAARFRLAYPAADSTRQMLAVTVAEMLRPLGIDVQPAGLSWDEIGRVAHAEPVLFGWGSHSPLELYSLYSSRFAGVDYYNAGFYANPTVDAYLAEAQNAATFEGSFPAWRKAEWDGETGFGMRGDAAWAWLVNLDHVYFVDDCLDIGWTQVEPHGHGWPVTASLLDWRWTCP